MKAVILAGGRGSRLGETIRELPKPMITIGDKPLLHHQVNLLLKYGIRDIIMLVNYLKEPIIEYFGNGEQFGTRISYYEEPVPLGTTGGIKEIENLLDEDYIVFYGDVMINMDLRRLIRFHHEKKSQCTLVLHPNDHPYDSDLVEISDDGRVVAFHAKPHPPNEWYHNMVNAGVYVLSPVITGFLQKGVKADFGRDVFPMIYHQVGMYGYHTSEYLKDMGTPDRLEKVNRDVEEGRVYRSNYELRQRAVFLDRDGVMNTERSYISKPDELELFDYTPSAVRKINQAGYLAVVVTNQSAIARNLCTEEDIRTIHKKLETVLGEQRAWLDDIYYCPHHPDKGFPEENPAYKIDCDCRKPKTGMFKKAISKFNIDPGLSYMIGDSERDIQAGINAGCTTIGVRTGYGVKKTREFPDYMFNDLAEAVNFIVNDPYYYVLDEAKRMYDDFSGTDPWIIAIGGNTRTGKSTLASYLRIGFERTGHTVLQVALDNWLLPETERTPNMNVFDRFRLGQMESDLESLFSGKPLSMNTYVNHHERKSAVVEYDPADARIIIVEGVVALNSAVLCETAHLRLFTTLDPCLFKNRIFEYYSWRGIGREDTLKLIEKRELDEYQLIEKESKLADLIINSSGS